MRSWFQENIVARFVRDDGSKVQLYSAISNSEGSLPVFQGEKVLTSNLPFSKPTSSTSKIFSLVLVGIVLASELFFVILFPSHNQTDSYQGDHNIHQPTESASLRQCGGSANSARNLSCIFDYLTISWEAPGCYHQDVVSDFLQARDWDFYEDMNGTSVSSWDEVTSGARRYNVQWDFHFTHCIYSWRMMQVAVLERRSMPDNLLAEEHTRHCIGTVLDRRWNFTDLHTLVHVKWPKCMPYGEWAMADFRE